MLLRLKIKVGLPTSKLRTSRLPTSRDFSSRICPRRSSSRRSSSRSRSSRRTFHLQKIEKTVSNARPNAIFAVNFKNSCCLFRQSPRFQNAHLKQVTSLVQEKEQGRRPQVCVTVLVWSLVRQSVKQLSRRTPD